MDPRATKAMAAAGHRWSRRRRSAELAREIGVEPDPPARRPSSGSTGSPASGVDGDFGRGNSAYDRYYGDPTVHPNPTSGPIEKGPFTAFKVVIGDLGTKGGVVTDADGRALREDGSVIEGLYSAGNNSASVMGRTYPGPGSTIGPAAVFGLRAARHMARQRRAEESGMEIQDKVWVGHRRRAAAWAASWCCSCSGGARASRRWTAARPGSRARPTRRARRRSRLSTHVVDITDRTAVQGLPAEVVAAHGAVDGLINNAGIIQPFVPVAELDDAAIERVLDVNLMGTLHMVRAFLPHLLSRPEAHLANVSSMGGFFPFPGQTMYGASKAAVRLLTEGLYAELLDTDVRVSVIFPGAVDTGISENSGVERPPGADAGRPADPSPAKAATIMIKGIEKNKLHIYVGLGRPADEPGDQGRAATGDPVRQEADGQAAPRPAGPVQALTTAHSTRLLGTPAEARAPSTTRDDERHPRCNAWSSDPRAVTTAWSCGLAGRPDDHVAQCDARGLKAAGRTL